MINFKSIPSILFSTLYVVAVGFILVTPFISYSISFLGKTFQSKINGSLGLLSPTPPDWD